MADSSESSLTATAARLVAALAEGMQLRVELFGVELEEERQRLVALVFSAVAMAVAVLLLAFSLNILLLALLWDTHRVAVTVGLSCVYAVATLAVLIRHSRMKRRLTPPFSGTAAVLARDQEALRGIR